VRDGAFESPKILIPRNADRAELRQVRRQKLRVEQFETAADQAGDQVHERDLARIPLD